MLYSVVALSVILGCLLAVRIKFSRATYFALRSPTVIRCRAKSKGPDAAPAPSEPAGPGRAEFTALQLELDEERERREALQQRVEQLLARRGRGVCWVVERRVRVSHRSSCSSCTLFNSDLETLLQSDRSLSAFCFTRFRASLARCNLFLR